MFTVTCPNCGNVNHGYAIECDQCNRSLKGVKRIESVVTSQPELYWTQIYDLFIDADNSISISLPMSNCFDCFSNKPTKIWSGLVPATSAIQTYGGTVGGTKITTTSRDLTLGIPLCLNCFTARNVFVYDPKFYDPTYQDNTAFQRISKIVGILFGISIVPLILSFINIIPGTIGRFFFLAAIILLVAWLILIRLSSSYDTKLKKGINEEVDMRFTWVTKGIKAKDIAKGFFAQPRYQWHFQLQFHNQKYWNLFQHNNQI